VIYVCIPAHEEARTVGVLLWKVRRVLGDFGRDYRIVVLDDASTDGTADVLARYRRALPLTILRSDERLGYGRSVERLLRWVVDEAPYPKRDCAVVLQGDFTESPEDVVGLVKILEGGADIVAGQISREGERAAPRSVRWARRLARVALGGVLRSAPVSDPLSGLRAYRVIVLKKAIRELPEGAPLIRSDGWAANLELLRALAPHARRMGESPREVRHDRRARPSRFHTLSTVLSLARIRGGTWWQGLDTEPA
jgi:glycosyltransferase involved in cell wall biosynthesis